MDVSLSSILLERDDLVFYNQYNALSFFYHMLNQDKSQYERLQYSTPGVPPMSFDNAMEQLETILFDRDVVERSFFIRSRLEQLSQERINSSDEDLW